MKRFFGILGSLMMILSFLAMPVAADYDVTSPSNSEEACLSGGGIFADLGDGVTTCTVVSVLDVVYPGSHPQQNWTATVRYTTTTVYTTTLTIIPGEIIGCLNRGGNPVDMPNDNCTTDNLHKFWTYIMGPDTIVMETSSTSTTESARIGCANSNGHQPEDWPENKNCVPVIAEP